MPKIRRLYEDDLSGFTPVNISNEQGVTFGERLTLKNLAADPEAAKNYLSGLGYEVRKLGEGFNFAVRKGTAGPWKVVDPAGFDFEDFSDLIGDAIFGVGGTALAAVGSVLGPLGTVAGAAVGSAATEAGRIALGKMAGINQDIKAKNLVAAGAAGAVGAVAVPVVSGLFRGVSRAARFAGREGVLPIMTRIGKVKRSAAVPATSIQMARTKIPGSGPIDSPAESVNAFLKVIRGERVGRNRFEGGVMSAPLPETAAINNVLDDLTLQDVTVNLRPHIQPILDLIPKKVVKAGKMGAGFAPSRAAATTASVRTEGGALEALTKSSIEGDAEAFIGNLNTILRMAKATDRNVPIKLANDIKSHVQEFIARSGGYSAQSERGLDALVDHIRDFAKGARAAINDAAVGAGRPEFTLLTDAAFKKTNLRAALSRQLGLDSFNDSVIKNKTATFLDQLYGPRGGWVNALGDIETNFGLPPGTLVTSAEQFAEKGHESIAGRFLISKAIGFQGQPELVAPFTAGGNLLGPSILGGVLGGPVGAVQGAGVGLVLGSPRVQLAMTRAGLRAGQVLTGFERGMTALRMSPEIRAASALGYVAAIDAARPLMEQSFNGPVAGAGTARSGQRRRRVVLTGQ